MTPALCACGRPVHYSDPVLARIMGRVVATCGDQLIVCCGGRRYRVQRHYLALHGLRAEDLTRLTAAGIVEEVE